MPILVDFKGGPDLPANLLQTTPAKTESVYTPPVRSRSDFAPVIAIAAFFAIAIAVVSPLGNFPLNDDWMYSYAAKCFAESGKFIFVGPNCAACLFHVVLGAAACKIFGFSHVVLRSITLGFAFAATLCVYFLAREVRTTRGCATFAALTFAASPLLMNLAFSYMTDVPSICLATLSTLLLVQGIVRNSALRLNLSGVALLCAIAVRQTNAVFIAVNVCVLLFLWCKRRHSWSVLLSLIVAPLIWFKTVDRIAPVSTNHPMAYGWYQHRVTGVFTGFFHTPLPALYNLSTVLGEVTLYLGLLLLPLLALSLPFFRDLFRHRARILGGWFAIGTGIAVVTVTRFVVIQQNLMPFSQNLLRIPIVGCLGIMGVSIANLSKQARLAITHVSAALSILLTAIVFAGTQRSIALLAKTFRNSSSTFGSFERRVLARNICCASALAAVSLVVVQSSIVELDRYFEVPCAAIAVFLVLTWRWLKLRPNLKLGAVVLAVFAIYSIAAEQDYMSWNRARWAAAQKLESQGVSWHDIDGGAEYDFEHNHELYNTHFRGAEPYSKWRWWSITGERYIISFSTLPGYDVAFTQPYFSCLSMSTRELFVMKKSTPESVADQ